MNQIVLTEQIGEGVFRVQDERVFSHLKTVLKIKVGSEVRVVKPGEFCGVGEVLNFEDGGCELRVIRKDERKKSSELGFYLPFVRPQSTKKIFEVAACCGVRSVEFFKSDKVEKSYLTSKVFREENIEASLLLGLEQGGWYDLPNIIVSPRKRLNDYLNSEVVVLHPYTDIHIEDLSIIPQNFILGPEGGWSEKEVDSLRDKKVKICRISDSILRIENAVTALIAQIELLNRISIRKS